MATCRPIIAWPVITDESGTPCRFLRDDGICVLPGGRGCIVFGTLFNAGDPFADEKRCILQISMDGEIELLAAAADDDDDVSSAVSIMSDGCTLLIVSGGDTM